MFLACLSWFGSRLRLHLSCVHPQQKGINHFVFTFSTQCSQVENESPCRTSSQVSQAKFSFLRCGLEYAICPCLIFCLRLLCVTVRRSYESVLSPQRSLFLCIDLEQTERSVGPPNSADLRKSRWRKKVHVYGYDLYVLAVDTPEMRVGLMRGLRCGISTDSLTPRIEVVFVINRPHLREFCVFDFSSIY